MKKITRHSFSQYAPLLLAMIAAGYLSLLFLKSLCPTLKLNLSEAGQATTAIGVLVSLLSLTLNHQRQSSEDFLNHSVDILSKAYELHSGKEQDSDSPKNDRTLWLAVARMIVTAQELSQNISVDSHKRIWEEQEQYWRFRFYNLIKAKGDGFPSDYYAEDPAHSLEFKSGTRPPLDESSLAVLYRFVEWPSSKKDDLSNIRGFTDEEIKKMELFGPRGLADYLHKCRAAEERYLLSIRSNKE